MKRKTLKILKCSVCGEMDYGDYMDTIDGKIYCRLCSEKLEDRAFIALCDEFLVEGRK